VRIKLTAIGDGVVLARPIDGTELGHEGVWDLHTRDWQAEKRRSRQRSALTAES